MKNLIESKKFSFPKKLRDTKNTSGAFNYLSQEDIQIYLRALFDQTRSFRFHCKKTLSKILYCTKSMHDKENIFGEQKCSFQKDLQITC